MSKLFASWVPGYAAVAERMGAPPLNRGTQTYSDVNGLRQGWGVTFHLQANQSNWFHFPLPTPAIVEDHRASLERVIVLFKFPPGATLNAVHVYDGPTRIVHRDNLAVTGTHLGLDVNNTFDADEAELLWGIGISVLVSAVQNSDIVFSGAGGDFRHDI